MTDSTWIARLASTRLLFACLLVALGACSASPSPSPAFSVPPASAGPDVVLDVYLRALVAGDCESGRKLATAAFRYGSGELCGATQVSHYVVNPGRGGNGATEVVFSTSIATTGTADGSIRPGGMTWFYDLMKQPDSSWRLVGGGTGP